MDEQKVLITSDGFGRIAIVRRGDGRFCLYEHWRWTAETQKAMNVQPIVERRWDGDDYDREAIYEYAEPSSGLFATVDEAEREARSRKGFADAVEEQRR